jgi:CheY-like chemotaxis protein
MRRRHILHQNERLRSLARPYDSANNVANKRVLCVDDSKQICAVISQLLEPVEVYPAYTISGALAAANSEKFDLFVIDVYLPDGVGPDLYVQLRENHPETPAIFITTSPDFSSTDVQELGAVDLIRKDSPNFVRDLLAISEKFLGSASYVGRSGTS